MSCIVGLIDGTKVILGADSAGGSGDEIYTIPARKVFSTGQYAIGVCGLYRVGQILRYKTELPDPPRSSDLESFMVRELAPAIRAAIELEGAAESDRVPLGGRTTLLIGCRGQLWHIGPDLTVLEETDFGAIGSGRLRAYAALHALQAVDIDPPQRRLELALEAAAAYTSTVRPPWHFVTTPGEAI